MNLSRTLAYATWAFSNVIKIAKDYTNKSSLDIEFLNFLIYD